MVEAVSVVHGRVLLGPSVTFIVGHLGGVLYELDHLVTVDVALVRVEVLAPDVKLKGRELGDLLRVAEVSFCGAVYSSETPRPVVEVLGHLLHVRLSLRAMVALGVVEHHKGGLLLAEKALEVTLLQRLAVPGGDEGRLFRPVVLLEVAGLLGFGAVHGGGWRGRGARSFAGLR